ncbi:MAG: carboxypeptidase-like regulatory domain-containing protein [Armatimonadota bacterium]
MIHKRHFGMVAAGAVAMGAAGLGLSLANGHGERPRLSQSTQDSQDNARHHQEPDYNGVISGRVRLSDGKSAEGLRVWARPVQRSFSRRSGGVAVVSASGEYRIEGLASEDFYVSVENDRDDSSYFAVEPRTVSLTKLTGMAQNVDFTLTLGPQITVRFRDAESGAPLSGITVKAVQRRSAPMRPLGTTDARGEYRFRATDIRTAIELAPKDRSGIGSRSVTVAPGSSFSRQITFPSAAQATDVVWEANAYTGDLWRKTTVLRGMVTGPDGKPVEHARLRLTRYRNPAVAHTNWEGRFSMTTTRMLPSENGEGEDAQRTPGLRIEAEKGDLNAVHFVTPEETRSGIAIQLKREAQASVTGQVVDKGGVPIAGVSVHYEVVIPSVGSGGRRPSASTDVNGRFTITGLSHEALYQFEFGGISGNGHYGRTLVPREASTLIDGKYVTNRVRLKPGEKRDLGRVVVLLADAALAGQVVT